MSQSFSRIPLDLAVRVGNATQSQTRLPFGASSGLCTFVVQQWLARPKMTFCSPLRSSRLRFGDGMLGRNITGADHQVLGDGLLKSEEDIF
jgi:hypothetical protein